MCCWRRAAAAYRRLRLLFDRPTFQQPERVPFQLMHNMVAAWSSTAARALPEVLLTQTMMRQRETLMTILEDFIYDPTLDL